MKNLILVACLLAVSYASDPINVKNLYKNFEICCQELKVEPKTWTLDVSKCSFQKHGLIDEKGAINKEKLLANLHNIISDKTRLDEATEFLSACFEQVAENPIPRTNDEKTMEFLICGTPAIALFDKP